MKKIIFLLLITFSVKSYAQVQLVSSGSGSAYTLTFPGVFSYSNGISFTFKAHAANTGAVTINVNSLGAKDIRKEANNALVANDIKTNQVVTLVYDGTNFQVTSDLPATGGGGGGTLVGDVTGAIGINTVEKIRGVNVIGTTPTTNQVLQYNGVNWAPSTLGAGGGNPAWELGGNAGTDSAINFIGTIDAKPLLFRTNNVGKMKLRQDGVLELFQGQGNAFVGDSVAVKRDIYSLRNTAFGVGALFSDFGFGSDNIAVGYRALYTFATSNASPKNIAIGSLSSYSASGDFFKDNVAIGYKSMFNKYTSVQNTLVGNQVMANGAGNGISNYNTGIGYGALYSNENGFNVAVGHSSMATNTSGANNTAIGYNSLANNSSGIRNTAIGSNSLWSNLTGSNNSGLGYFSNVSDGVSNSTSIGANAVATISNAVVIGDTTNAKVGIGTGAPTANLHVDGTFRLQGNGAAIGRVLVSDALGNAAWQALGPGGGISTAWELSGNTAIATDFIGTTNAENLRFKANGNQYMQLTTDGALWLNQGNSSIFIGDSAGFGSIHTGFGGFWNKTVAIGAGALKNGFAQAYEGTIAIGYKALENLGTEGTGNVAIGTMAMNELSQASGDNTAIGNYALQKNQSSGNTAVGASAMLETNGGSENTAIGSNAMSLATGGSFNVTVGVASLQNNVGGHSNTALGYYSMNAFNEPNPDFAEYNTAVGSGSMAFMTTGSYNTAVGSDAMSQNSSNNNSAFGKNALHDANNGGKNNAFGANALYANLAGFNNVAIGYDAMRSNTEGHDNTAVGSALRSNTTGHNNVAMGSDAMLMNIDGYENTAIGNSALFNSSTNYNTAVGFGALQDGSGTSNTAIGHYALKGASFIAEANVAVGKSALLHNQYGSNNVAMGLLAMQNNSSGYNNVGIGTLAMSSNIDGYGNTALGYQALITNTSGTGNVAMGYQSLTSNTDGTNNTALGSYASTSSSSLTNATAIGYQATANASDKIRLGDANVTVIEGQVAYSFPSDGRFKTNISNADVKGLDFITKLRPVNYNFDTKKYEEFLTKNMPDSIRRKILAQDFTKSTALRQTGFIAQEIEKAAKEAGYDFSGGLHIPENENDNYSVAYSQFVVPLVKSVQELNAKVTALENENKVLKNQTATTTSSPTKTAEGFKGDEHPEISAERKEIDALKNANAVLKSSVEDMKKQMEEMMKLLKERR